VRDLFVTGTDTGVGKTVLSATLVIGLEAAYWKPIQSGRLGGDAETDRESVVRWAGLEAGDAPPEAFVFDPPVSPHLAARTAGVRIDLSEIRKPAVTGKRLIIEGAGGVLVPINDKDLMLDLIGQLDAAVVIASHTGLGTINHTLLTVNSVRQAKLNLIGVVMIGEENVENMNAIEHYGNIPVVGQIPLLPTINQTTLRNAYENHFDREAFDE
jgi:dethiobiotin synthetase